MDFTKRNSSALIYATAAHHARIVQMPLEAETDVYRPRMLADSAEMLAGTVNDVEDPTAIDSTISMLLIQQGFNVQVTGERGSTLLHYMANCGYAALFAVLIELNLEVNRQNDDGRTPLMPWSDLYSFPPLQLHVKTAYPDRPLSLLKTFVDAGALVPCQDNYGRTPILLAVWGNQNVVMFLIQKRCAGLPFLVVIRRLLVGLPDEARQVVKRLLNAGMDLESVRDPNGRTPLMAAICSGSTQVFMMMFNKISVVDERDYEGRTALFIATQIGNLQIVHLLLSVLFYAPLCGHELVVNILLERGANIENTDIEGRTPLAGAARNGHAEVVLRLLEKGACPEPEDRRGKTSLLLAAMKGYSNTIAVLLPYGVNVNKVDSYHRTALSLAAERGSTALIRLLLRQPGNEVDHPDATGRTPLVWVVRAGNVQAVQL
ncbi:hypothetical protein AFCA_012457 [Aspergillus flavus]|nr:hypothetical protein AFCA_012457 [Aspergillus flavus]